MWMQTTPQQLCVQAGRGIVGAAAGGWKHVCLQVGCAVLSEAQAFLLYIFVKSGVIRCAATAHSFAAETQHSFSILHTYRKGDRQAQRGGEGEDGQLVNTDRSAEGVVSSRGVVVEGGCCVCLPVCLLLLLCCLFVV